MNPIFTREPISTEAGILRFTDSTFYWLLTIPRENLRKLVECLKDLPMLDACRKANVEPQYITGYYRSDFIYQLPYRKDSSFRVLDLGSGFGNITIPLAKRMDTAEIYAVDGSLDILRLLKARADQEGCTKIIPVQSDAFEYMNLPFAPGTFDLILLNGVLEWLGSGVQEGDPGEWQKKCLAYLRTLLRPGGTMYIGIEARYFLGYFMGIRDPHSQLRFTSVVPRFVGNFLAHRAGKSEGYRTYLYSYWGYRKLLRTAGFESINIDTLYTVASYKDPYYIFSVNDKAAYYFAFTTWARQLFPSFRGRFAFTWFYRLGLEKFFSPGFMLLAREKGGTATSSLFHTIVDTLLDKCGVSLEGQILKIDSNKADDSCVNFLYFVPGSKTPTLFIKIKRTGTFSSDQQAVVQHIKESLDFVLTPEVSNQFAEIYSFHALDSFPMTVGSVRTCAELLRVFHGNPEADTRLQQRQGLVHGDYTIENVAQTNGRSVIYDLEHVTSNGTQADDICSLILHFYMYGKGLRDAVLVDALSSPEALSIVHAYKPTATVEEFKEVFLDFLTREEKRYQTSREGKYRLYHELRAIYTERMLHSR